MKQLFALAYVITLSAIAIALITFAIAVAVDLVHP